MTPAFLLLRALHVLLAAVWIGSTVFVSVLLMPAIEQSGAAGGEVMNRINRGGIVTYMAILGGTTVLTGIYLYWRFTLGFDPAISASRTGMAFGIGGLAGIVAVVVGGSVVGRSANNTVKVMAQAVTATGAAKESLLQEAARLRQRMKTGGLAVIILQAIALLLMSIAHYI